LLRSIACQCFCSAQKTTSEVRSRRGHRARTAAARPHRAASASLPSESRDGPLPPIVSMHCRSSPRSPPALPCARPAVSPRRSKLQHRAARTRKMHGMNCVVTRLPRPLLGAPRVPSANLFALSRVRASGSACDLRRSCSASPARSSRELSVLRPERRLLPRELRGRAAGRLRGQTIGAGDLRGWPTLLAWILSAFLEVMAA
jgi:hypothetical protein